MLLATANIWGLPAPLSWPPRRVRFPRLRGWLEAGLNLDVVALQEHWRIPGRTRALLDRLELIHPAPGEGDSGLALHTRLRVLACDHGTFREGAVHPLERRFSRKGWQRVVVDAGTRVEVFNTHLEAHAGDRHARVRAAQLDELLGVAAGAAGAVVLAGDFNLYADGAEDRVSLASIEAAGFEDAVAPFDPTATYARFGRRERFDRVFVRGLRSKAARVDVHARLADHHPVIVELQ